MRIESIVPIDTKKNKVCLKDGTDFVLYKKECKKLELVVDMELEEEQYQQMLQDIFIPRAKKRAMHLLVKMPRTSYQLTEKLRENGYPKEAIQEALDYVTSFHYIDDEQLAIDYVTYYKATRSRGRLTQDLMKKGLSKEMIEKALAQIEDESQQELIHKLLQKKNYSYQNASWEEKGKMYRFLAQKGFSSEEIRRALQGEWDT